MYRIAMSLLLLALGVGAFVASPARASAEEPRVDCGNYREHFAPGSVVARRFAEVCGDDVERPAPAPAPVPTPPPARNVEFEQLRATIAERIAGYRIAGQYAVAVTDLQTGEAMSVGGDRLQLAGCSINFFVLMQAALDVQRGRYPEARVGDLIQNTAYYSSATRGLDLYAVVGNGDAFAGIRTVRGLIASMGLGRTVLDHAPGYISTGSVARSDNYMTADESNRALAKLWAGSVLAPEWRDYLLAKMGNIKPGLNYLTAYGIGGVSSHKNGFFPVPSGGSSWVDNDIGIVRFERSGVTRAYAISFFSQQVTQKYGSLGLFQPISELVWEYFNRKYS